MEKVKPIKNIGMQYPKKVKIMWNFGAWLDFYKFTRCIICRAHNPAQTAPVYTVYMYIYIYIHDMLSEGSTWSDAKWPQEDAVTLHESKKYFIMCMFLSWSHI